MTPANVLAALEAATVGSRELDEMIGRAVGWRNLGEKSNDDGAVCGIHLHASPFTTSIDAALTLVPEGGEWWLETDVLTGGYRARIVTKDIWTLQCGKAPTAPLAICIAALRARAAQPQPGEG